MNHKSRHKKRINEHRRKWIRRGRKGGKGAAWRKSTRKVPKSKRKTGSEYIKSV